MNSKDNNFYKLLDIVNDLREKCPWDKNQTVDSLRILTLEEVYELSEAIILNDKKNIKEELGDVLLHIVFYAKIFSEQNNFNINDIIENICDKLIQRHPHIYSDLVLKTEDEVRKNWEKIKIEKEKKSIFEGIPKYLPSLIKAFKIQERAKSVDFDWDKKEDVWKKVKEEEQEFLDEVHNMGSKERIEEEFGDLLFTLINYARHLGIDPDTSLERSNNKFISRFNLMEKLIKEDGKNIYNIKLKEKDIYWNKSKKLLRNNNELTNERNVKKIFGNNK